MDPELEFSQNQGQSQGHTQGQRPIPPAHPGDQAERPQNIGMSAEALDLTAEKVLAKELAAQSATKGPRPQSKTYKHPMVIDLLLAVGLLFAMAAMTVSFVRTYITHSAKTSILQGNYKAAIGILHGSPIPEFFGGAGTDSSEDLLNQALYLDAMEKLDNNRDDQTALQELAKVSPGSSYYDMAQEQFRKLKSPPPNVAPQDGRPQGNQPQSSAQERTPRSRPTTDKTSSLQTPTADEKGEKDRPPATTVEKDQSVPAASTNNAAAQSEAQPTTEAAPPPQQQEAAPAPEESGAAEKAPAKPAE